LKLIKLHHVNSFFTTAKHENFRKEQENLKKQQELKDKSINNDLNNIKSFIVKNYQTLLDKGFVVFKQIGAMNLLTSISKRIFRNKWMKMKPVNIPSIRLLNNKNQT